MARNAWRVTPQQTDPLSWFARPLIPLAFGVMALLYGTASVIATWNVTAQPWLDMIAVGLVAGACLVVQAWTHPLRPTFSRRQAVVPDLMAIAAIVLASMSAKDAGVFVQHWWVPVGVGFVLGTLTPFSTVRHTIFRGLSFSTAAALGAAFAFFDPASIWPALSVIIIAAGGVLVATVAAAVFAWVLVTSTQRIVAGAGLVPDADDEENEQAARQVERRTLARLGSMVGPFLQGVADAGVVTDDDRALAGQLARRLRSDLVTQANRSWLDSLALSGPMYVVDPDYRADQMNPVQRTAMRGLLRAVMTDPLTRSGSLFVELRGQPDGSTAVALSVDIDLPEGNRVMMIAPYYLSLQGSAEELSWGAEKELLRFRLPAPPR